MSARFLLPRMRAFRRRTLLLALVSACAAHLALGQSAGAEDDVGARIVEGTIVELQRALQSGEITCEQVVSAHLDRIDAYDRERGLNAITQLAPEAMMQARAAGASIRRRAAMAPLFCVPIVVKDNIDTAGLPTTAGSIALRDATPPDDAAVVRALRRAGAIVLAKTNMAEWAFSPRRTISSTAGETANAYASDRVPAGSSGGTATAVATSFALAGLGTDTGNSVRGPSSHLALVGMRPTYGRVSLDGVIPLLADRDAVGPMTRTVEDSAHLLSVMATTATAPEAPSDVDYVAHLKGVELHGARIGVLRALAEPRDMDPEIAALFDAAIAALRRAGAVVVDEIDIDGFSEHVERGYYCPRFRADVNAYLSTLGSAAPLRDVVDVRRAGRFAEASREQFEFFIRDEGGGLDPAECISFESNTGRQRFRSSVTQAMERARVLALIYPSWMFPPALRERAVEDYRGDNSQLVAPATGLPAITVPMGFTNEGLPAGVQFLGRAWSEATLYSLAWRYEQLTRHRAPPRGFPVVSARRVSGS